MANKKNETTPYGSIAVPGSESRNRIIRWGWNGLNKTHTIDSGNITDCSGVFVRPPYVEAFPKIDKLFSNKNIINVYGFDDYFITVIRNDDGTLGIGQIWFGFGEKGFEHGTRYCHVANNTPDVHRTVLRFNVAVNTENIAAASYAKKLLILPDKYSVELSYDEEYGRYVIPNEEDASAQYLGDEFPKLKYAAVYASRLFGVDDSKVYASEFNNYAGWRLDTANDFSEAHAWISMTQSNTRADGLFTGIYTYDNHVLLFKKDFTQLVYSDSNPFRIVDLTAFGAENPNAIAEANGILYFASSNNVYAFTGGVPKPLGDDLDIPDYTGVCLGSYKDKLFMCVNDTLYMYADGAWSKTDLGERGGFVQFASTTNGIFGLRKDSQSIYQVFTKDFEEHPDDVKYGDWWFETDLMCAGKLDIRRVKKLSLMCEMAKNTEINVYLLRDDEEFNPETSEDSKIISFVNYGKQGKKVLRGLVRGFSGFAHKLRICGSGRAKIYSAELLVTFGGDLYRNE